MPAAAVLVDTGPLVALFDPSDAQHVNCTKELARLERDRLLTTLAVVTEASRTGFDTLLTSRRAGETTAVVVRLVA